MIYGFLGICMRVVNLKAGHLDLDVRCRHVFDIFERKLHVYGAEHDRGQNM